MKKIPFDKQDIEAIYNELVLLYRATKTSLGSDYDRDIYKTERLSNIPDFFDLLAYHAAVKQGLPATLYQEVGDNIYLSLKFSSKDNYLYGYGKHFNPDYQLSDGSSGERRKVGTDDLPALFPVGITEFERVFYQAAVTYFNIPDFIGDYTRDPWYFDTELCKRIKDQMFNEYIAIESTESLFLTSGHVLTFSPVSFSIDKKVLEESLERFKKQDSFGVITDAGYTIPIGKLLNWSIEETGDPDPSYNVYLEIQWTKEAADNYNLYGRNTIFIPQGNAVVKTDYFAPSIHFTTLDNIALVFDEEDWWSN